MESCPLLQYVTFSSPFHNVAVTKACFLACDGKPDFTQLRRTVHICCEIWTVSGNRTTFVLSQGSLNSMNSAKLI